MRSSDGLIDTDVAFPVEMGGAGGATNPEQLFAAGYAATLLCAVLSWRFVEAPALSLKKRFLHWKRNSGSARPVREY